MVERIRILLESRRLTPTQFADQIGVARPIISHVLSGRNKPSLDVVQRILAAMPDVSMPWLLNGTGPMVTPAPGATLPNATAAPAASSKPASADPSAGLSSSHDAGSAKAGRVPKATSAPAADHQMAASAQPTRAVPPFAASQPTLRQAPRPFRPRVPSNSAHEPVAAGRTPTRTGLEELPADAGPNPAVTAEPLQQPSNRASTAAAALLTSSAEAALAALSGEVPPTDARRGVAVAPATPAGSSSTLAEQQQATAVNSFLQGGDKLIRRIVIFYQDGSFADFRPE